jgi:uncharacterized membrane protein
VPVVKFQIQATHLAAVAARTGQPLPARYHVIMHRWFLLGWPAFGALIIIFVLMIAKPTLW